MVQIPSESPPGLAGLSARQRIAFDRIQELIATAERRAARAFRSNFSLQALTVALAAITPCLIFLAKDNPRNELLNWLQLFFPAVAAITAAVTHLFHWREDGVRYTSLAESIRSQLWRFQTRSGEFGGGLTDEQALEKLVTRVDDLNLQALARWSSTELADSPAPAATPKAT